MSPLLNGIIRWGPIVLFIVICTVLLQEVWGRPRLRHSHRKLRCFKCPPGWGVSRKCTDQTDTECSPCGSGSYSPHHSYHTPCWVCSRCGPGLFEAHPCHSAADTICDDCNRSGVSPNADFMSKCHRNASEEEFLRGKVRWTHLDDSGGTQVVQTSSRRNKLNSL